MSRSVAAATTDNLSATPAASFTTWAAGGWFYFTSFVDLARLFHTDPNAAGLRGALRLSGTGGALQAQTACATTNADRVTSTTITLNKWWFIAALIDASNVLHIYIGDQATPVAEASYASSTTGVGAITSWNHLHFGANHGGAAGMTGRIGRPFVHNNSSTLIGLADLRAVQFGQYSVLIGPGLIGLWDLSNPDPARNPFIAGAASDMTATASVANAEEPPAPFRLAA